MATMRTTGVILYEYPFNERVRNLLRLEDQFERLFFFVQQADPRAHHAALTTLFEITDSVARSSGRADIRTDLLHDLERQRLALVALREHPAVQADLLDATIQQIQDVLAELGNQGKPGDTLLRQHEWLNTLRSRLVIPGGVCEFDMPSYFAWQHRPPEERASDLQQWYGPLMPLYNALNLDLHLLRQNAETSEVVAREGMFQQSPEGRPYQLLRVYLPDDSRMFPEISANKYSISIRFAIQDGPGKPHHVSDDVAFHMGLCTSF
jgi:cell division protein ZapD